MVVSQAPTGRPTTLPQPTSLPGATVNAGGSSVSYDAATDQYNYVWKTNKAWKGTCRMFALKLDNAPRTSPNSVSDKTVEHAHKQAFINLPVNACFN